MNLLIKSYIYFKHTKSYFAKDINRWQKYVEKLIELDKQNKLSDYIQESIIFFYEVYENEKTLKQQ